MASDKDAEEIKAMATAIVSAAIGWSAGNFAAALLIALDSLAKNCAGDDRRRMELIDRIAGTTKKTARTK